MDGALGPGTKDGVIPFGGTGFFYRTLSAGTPVVALHGGPALGHAYLRPAMDTLAARFRVVYFDQRGSGRTPVGDPGRLNLRGAVEDLRGVLDGLGIARANLLGHSYGADLAVLFAAAFPERIGSLVLANPGPPFDTDGMRILGAEMRARRTADDDAALVAIERSPAFRRREPQAVEEYIRNVYLPFFDDRLVAAAVRYELTEHSAATVLEAEGAFFADGEYMQEALTRAGRVTAPTLVVYAEHDPTPEAFARSLADRIPGSRYEFLGGASHFALIENPQALFGIVTPFLESAAEGD